MSHCKSTISFYNSTCNVLVELSKTKLHKDKMQPNYLKASNMTHGSWHDTLLNAKNIHQQIFSCVALRE